MKNSKLTALLLVIVIACLCATFVACNDKGNGDNDVDNNFIPSVTVTPAPDDGIPDIEYKVTVLFPDRSPAVGVEVQLFLIDDDEVFCSATTGSDGIAVLTTSKDTEYFIAVTRLPDGYAYTDDDLISDSETEKTVYLEDLNQTNIYSISVVSEGGMPMKGVSVSLKNDSGIVATKLTADNGIASIKVTELGVYGIELADLPKGYSMSNADQKTSADSASLVVKVKSSVIKEEMPANHSYKMDDIMYDFTVTTSDGGTFQLSEVLKEKKLVMINFWATWCGPCRNEFDDIQNAYERYQDDMTVIAMSIEPSDSESKVATFKSEYRPLLTIDMTTKQNNIYGMFSAYNNGGSIPFTVFVDRYGKICNYIAGSGTEALFKQEFARYTAADYVQTAFDPANDEIPIEEGDKPEVNMPDSSEIVSAISGNLGGTYSEIGDGKVWPWLLGKEDGQDVLYAGNIDHNNTESRIDYTFKLAAGQFLTFDYYMNTEDIGNADILSVYIDGSWMCDLDRVSDGWKTMHLYTPISSVWDTADADRDHTLTLHYIKDASDGSYLDGDEKVAIKNVRAVGENDLQGDVNVLREATWNLQEVDGVNKFVNHVDVFLNPVDGYYHVGSEDGPLLMANLGGSTHYHTTSVNEFALSYFELAGIKALATFISNGVSNPPANSYVEASKGYSWFSKNSDLPNYCYVDERLYMILDAMTAAFAETLYQGNYLGTYNEYSWLEFCAYYDNYNGNSVGNIMQGISNKEAFIAVDGDQPNHVVVNKTLVPRGIMYKYTADKTGAYKIYSVIPEEYASQQGGYVYITGDGVLKSEDAIDDFEQYVSFEAGKTYYIGVAFDIPSAWGELDFYIKYLNESADNFTYVSDGTYTYIIDENGNIVYDKNDQIIYVLNKTNNLEVELGEDNYYHQVLADGSIDMGENSHIWISIANDNEEQGNNLLHCTLLDLALGNYRIDGQEVPFFDFTSDGGEDYTQKIINIAAQSIEGKTDKDPTYGMVKADAELVEIIKKALARIGHDSDESWLGVAYFYEHLGTYPAVKPVE